MRLLLISNSTNPGEPYLDWPKNYIKDFLGNSAEEVLFIPYAGVNLSPEGLTASFDVYAEKVSAVFQTLGYRIRSIHQEKEPVKAAQQAQAIAVGGGNTFHLVYMLHRIGLMQTLREKALSGIPFLGWSAGANIACPTLRTTNDMPIIQPESFNTLNLVPFQINPHYLDAHPEGHGGETREQRIQEFLAINWDITVVGLREACLLQLENNFMELKGRKSLRVFQYGKEAVEYQPGTDLSFLLK